MDVMDMTYTERLKPEPATEREKECMNELELSDYEIYSAKLNMIVEEGKEVFVRTGVSSMLHSGDVVAAIYTAQGDLVTASAGTYLHAVVGQPQIKFIVNQWGNNPSVGIKEGDIFYCNDAVYGGVHNPDQSAILPIFSNGELIAWVAAACHQPETGACEPGGMPVTSRSRYDEGLKISPMKVGENYTLREDILYMFANMVSRAPRMQMIDVRARFTGCDRVRVRLQDLAMEKGNDFLIGLFRKMIQIAADGARKRISALVDGTFRGVVFMDHIGIDEGLQRAFCTLTKKGDKITIDYSGTSPETGGPYNSFKHCTIAHGAMYLYGIPFTGFPLSAGIWEAIDFTVPKGTCLNASPDAAVANAVMACSMAMCLINLTFSKLLFASGDKERACSPWGNNGDAYVNAGVNQWGIPFADMLAYPLNAEGGGANYERDGVDSWGFPWAPWGRGPDAEDEEHEKPFIHLFQKHLRDSSGMGKNRGGSGLTVAWVLKDVPFGVFQSIIKSSRVQALQSFYGGYPPPPHPGIQVMNTNVLELLAQGEKKIPTDVYELITEQVIKGEYEVTPNLRAARVFGEGDIYVGCSHGSVGYGDVLERDAGKVVTDVKKGLVSHWVAKNVYHVIYDPETYQVNYEETEKERLKEREDRKQRGVSYDEFEQKWLKKKPHDEILKYYGSWPDAKVVAPIMRM